MGTSMSTTNEKEVIWEGSASTELPMNCETNGESVVCDITTITKDSNENEHLPDTTESKISGIYKIINKVNGKYYVGSSDDIRRRWEGHILLLNKNKHHNQHLQSSWNKYGEDTFIFVIIEYALDKYELLKREQYYLVECKNNPDKNYNISYDALAPMAGRKHSPETIEKMCISQSGENNPMFGKVGANRGKTFPKEWRDKISKNSSRFWTGKKLSEETKRKQSESHMGKNNPNYGRKLSEEHRHKMSLSRKRLDIFTIKNVITSETFKGTIYTLKEKLSVHKDTINRFVNHHRNSCRGWIILPSDVMSTTN
jgi:group I intron endonuclease